MLSTRTAKTAKTAATCLVVLAGMFAGSGGALAATGTGAADDDMPWGVVKPIDPAHPGSARYNADMPWG
ncbi:hypothetical protein ACN6AT_31210 [Streptomyces sp. JL4002]|uniref:hypothetical protein n=1 Tax=Streptomyces TaxID=1883 RepID=UPI00340B323A